MTCPNCNEPVDNGAAFCGNCGQALIGQMPAAQVLANQPKTRPQRFGIPALSASGVGVLPAYAVAQVNPVEHSGETKSIIGLLLGVIAIPASLIPIAGLGLGVTAMVFSTIARSHYKKALSLVAIIFSALGILASLGMWVYFAEQASHNMGKASTANSSAHAVAINTPCYSVKIDSGMNNYSPSGCTFDSASASEEFTVAGSNNPTVNMANLVSTGHQNMSKAAANINATIDSEGTAQFAGSPAYIAQMHTGDKYLVVAYVLHTTAGGDNVFAIIRVGAGYKPSFGTMETNWQWKN